MWKVVYIAQTAEAAARIKEVLAANGFLTQTKTTNSKHGVKAEAPAEEKPAAEKPKHKCAPRKKKETV